MDCYNCSGHIEDVGVLHLLDCGLSICLGCMLKLANADAREYQNESDGLPDEDYDLEDGLSDIDADSMTLASAGYGTDEDYGYAEDVY